MAAALAAGLWGIEENKTPPPPVDADASARADLLPLPRTLREATEVLAKSQRARQLLGDAFIDHYVRTRDWECRQYERVVTEWELKRYFEVI
jgi:glutamine synthetase